jgi:hypothetical protein
MVHGIPCTSLGILNNWFIVHKNNIMVLYIVNYVGCRAITPILPCKPQGQCRRALGRATGIDQGYIPTKVVQQGMRDKERRNMTVAQ